MASLSVVVNNEPLDLPTGFRFEQIIKNELANLGEFQADFSIPTRIAATPRNNKLLNQANLLGIKPGLRVINAQIWQNNSTKYNGDLVIIESTEEYYEIAFYTGENRLTMQNANLRELDLGEIPSPNSLKDLASPVLNSGNSLVFWPQCHVQDTSIKSPVTYSRKYFNEYDHISGSYRDDSIFLPFVFLKPLIELVLSKFGYTLTGTFVDTYFFKNLGFPTNVLIDEYYMENHGDSETHLDVTDFTNQGDNPIPLFQGVNRYSANNVTDPIDAWSVVAKEYTIKAPGVYTIQAIDIQIQVTKTGGIPQIPQDYATQLDLVYAGNTVNFGNTTGQVDNDDEDDNYYSTGPHVFTATENDVGKKIFILITVDNIDNTNQELRDGVFKIHWQPTASYTTNFPINRLMPNVIFGDIMDGLQKIPGVQVHNDNVKKELKIDFYKLSEESRRINITPYVLSDPKPKKRYLDPANKGINYGFPDHYEDAPEGVVKQWLEFKKDLPSAANNGELYHVAEQHAIYQYLGAGEFKVYPKTRPIKYGSPEDIDTTIYYPILMEQGTDLVSPIPKPEHEYWQSLWHQDQYNDYKIQLCIYHGLKDALYQNQDLHPMPMATTHNHIIQNVGMWGELSLDLHHPTYGLKPLIIEDIIVLVDGEELEVYCHMPEHVASQIFKGSTFWYKGVNYILNEAVRQYSQNDSLLTKLKMKNANPKSE